MGLDPPRLGAILGVVRPTEKHWKSLLCFCVVCFGSVNQNQVDLFFSSISWLNDVMVNQPSLAVDIERACYLPKVRRSRCSRSQEENIANVVGATLSEGFQCV